MSEWLERWTGYPLPFRFWYVVRFHLQRFSEYVLYSLGGYTNLNIPYLG